jgi:hypothetical protein
MPSTPTVEALLEQWIDAFNRHDLDAHMQLYTQDALLFGSVDTLQVGRDAIRAYFGGRAPASGLRTTPGRRSFRWRPMFSPQRLTSTSRMGISPCPTV